MSLWLTSEELVELTGYRTSRCQKRALGEMGVEFIARAQDGFPLVKRAQFSAHTVLTKPTRKREPNWTSIHE